MNYGSDRFQAAEIFAGGIFPWRFFLSCYSLHGKTIESNLIYLSVLKIIKIYD